jgi:uncharacterized protein with HEPN domain
MRRYVPHREWTFRISDILECFAKIQRYTAGMSISDFEKNEMAIDAVLRNISIIGEATRYIPDDIQTRYPAVPWSLMRGMRNLVVHQYENVDLDLTWDTITRQIPPLIRVLNDILERESSEQRS